MEQQNLFSFLEQTPTEAMKDVTPPQQPPKQEQKANFADITANTSTAQQQLLNAPPFQQQSQTINAGSLLNASVMVELVNTIMPALLVMAIKRFAKKNVVKKQFSATVDEKKMLEPIIENYLKSVNFNIQNPFNALMLGLVIVYGMKTIEVLNTTVADSPVNAAGLKETIPQEEKGGRPPKPNAPLSAYMRKKMARQQHRKYTA